MKRHALTDAQWARLEPLLPPQRSPHGGRAALPHPRILNGILWVLATGAPWRDLPSRYGRWQTVYSRFRRWQLAGVWDQLFVALKQQANAARDLDWTLQFVDGTTVRAHPHAAPHAVGARRGKTPDGQKRGPRSKR